MKRRKRPWFFVGLAGVVAASACSQESKPTQAGNAGSADSAGDAGSPETGGSAGSAGASGRPNGDAGASPSAEGGGESGRRHGESGAPSTAGEAGLTGRGGTGASTGGGGAGAGGAHGQPFPCKSPRSFDGGYVACSTDAPENFVYQEFSEVRYSYLHRPSTGSCPNALSYEGEPGSEGVAGAAGAGGYGWGDSCTSNVDCGAPNYCGTRGYRSNYCDDGGAGPQVCQRGCETDADCGEQSICLCGNLLTLPSPLGICVAASCKTDADCEPGYRCASEVHEAYEIRFSCQTPDDECAGNDDCFHENGAGGANQVSSFECTGGARRTCGVIECAYDWGIGG